MSDQPSFNTGSVNKPMDMALDDIIKSRQKEPRRTPRKNAGKNPSNAAKATGANKAKRSAAQNARRGITANRNASKMDVDEQVNRQQKRGYYNDNRGTKSNAGRRATAPSAASVRAKAMNKIKNQPKNNNSGAARAEIQAPSTQAISAAANAMKDFGFKPPKGMQMQISFVPKPNPPNKRGNNNQNGGRRGPSNMQGYNNQGNNNQGNNNQGGGRRGGRGGGSR